PSCSRRCSSRSGSAAAAGRRERSDGFGGDHERSSAVLSAAPFALANPLAPADDSRWGRSPFLRRAPPECARWARLLLRPSSTRGRPGGLAPPGPARILEGPP